MPYQRGDVIELPFLIPHNSQHINHPAIIISNKDVYNADGVYVCVMVTHSNINSEFAFQLTKEMFVDSSRVLDGYVKAHLIAYVLASHIVSNSNRRVKMKSTYVNKLVDFINDNVLTEI